MKAITSISPPVGLKVASKKEIQPLTPLRPKNISDKEWIKILTEKLTSERIRNAKSNQEMNDSIVSLKNYLGDLKSIIITGLEEAKRIKKSIDLA